MNSKEPEYVTEREEREIYSPVYIGKPCGLPKKRKTRKDKKSDEYKKRRKRLYYINNREKILAQKKGWHERNKECIRQGAKDWCVLYPEKKWAQDTVRHARDRLRKHFDNPTLRFKDMFLSCLTEEQKQIFKRRAYEAKSRTKHPDREWAKNTFNNARRRLRNQFKNPELKFRDFPGFGE